MTLPSRPLTIPKHIAIIMDGNGRWAQRRGRPRVFGHVRGASRLRPIIEEADRIGIKAVTLFAFSTENWLRPESELKVLWKLLKKFLLKEMEELHRRGVRLRAIGEIEKLDPEIRQILDRAIKRMAGNSGLMLTFAVSYGGRRDICRATINFARDCVAGKANAEDMDESLMWNYLWTRDLGELADVDLVIRTSGEQRVSNFLIWQAAYAEYVFPDLCWPDFTPSYLRAAVEEFSGRNRRFGRVESTLPRGLNFHSKREKSEGNHAISNNQP